MTLTQEQSAQLKDFFPVDAHEFLQGKTYIREDDITDRLDKVDPSWEFIKLDITNRDKQIIATYRLIVCGVSRDGVGMAQITMTKTGDNEANEAEKSAATDALKRAARLFGIGRYLLNLKGVNDPTSLANWLARQRGVNQSTGEISVVQSDRTPQQALKGNGPSERNLTAPTSINSANSPSDAIAGAWAYDLPQLMAHPDLVAMYKSFQHRSNAIKKLHELGLFENVTFTEAVKVVLTRPDKQEAIG